MIAPAPGAFGSAVMLRSWGEIGCHSSAGPAMLGAASVIANQGSKRVRLPLRAGHDVGEPLIRGRGVALPNFLSLCSAAEAAALKASNRNSVRITTSLSC